MNGRHEKIFFKKGKKPGGGGKVRKERSQIISPQGRNEGPSLTGEKGWSIEKVGKGLLGE